MKLSVFIGFDPREAGAFAVAKYSLQRRVIMPIPVRGLVLSDLRAKGLYRRPTSVRDGRMWDDISEAPMATEFAVSRFLIPEIARGGWALFMDCDMLVRGNVEKLFAACDHSKAVMVVKHHYDPPAGVKMDGQEQTRYARKNWSSVMALNCSHPANRALTVDYVNSVPGRDLHRFAWLDDDMIGELDPSWNYLVGHHNRETVPDPQIVHFTEGFPLMKGYENCDYSDEWNAEFQKWAMSS